MKMLPWFLMALVAAGLVYNYSKDKGHHTLAKVFHFVALMLLAYIYGPFAPRIVPILGHLGEYLDIYGGGYSFLPGQLGSVYFLVHTALVITLLILIGFLTGRKEGARKAMVVVVPLLGITEFIAYLNGWSYGAQDSGDSLLPGIFSGAALVGTPTVLLTVLYASSLMRKFFASGSENESEASIQPFDFRE